MNRSVLLGLILFVTGLTLFVLHAINHNMAGMITAIISFICGAILTIMSWKGKE